jgi:ABC-type phosphate/phosphonate transport system substrate-binding protein
LLLLIAAAGLAASGLAAPGLAAAEPAPFRIAVLAKASGACAKPTGADAGERAYFDLLAKRLERPVVACPVASLAEGAAELAAGRADMAVLDEANYRRVSTAARATLTVRSEGGLTRVPIYLAVRASGPAGDAASMRGRKVAFGGSNPVALALPKQVLAEQGLGPRGLGPDLVLGDEGEALAALRAGRADAVALHAAAWQRQCRPKAQGDKPCADLKIVWRARPKAERAWSVRRDLKDPERFRLIGVHIPMHLEDKAAFAWAAGQLAPGAADFEAAEADALVASHLP